MIYFNKLKSSAKLFIGVRFVLREFSKCDGVHLRLFGFGIIECRGGVLEPGIHCIPGWVMDSVQNIPEKQDKQAE